MCTWVAAEERLLYVLLLQMSTDCCQSVGTNTRLGFTWIRQSLGTLDPQWRTYSLPWYSSRWFVAHHFMNRKSTCCVPSATPQPIRAFFAPMVVVLRCLR